MGSYENSESFNSSGFDYVKKTVLTHGSLVSLCLALLVSCILWISPVSLPILLLSLLNKAPVYIYNKFLPLG